VTPATKARVMNQISKHQAYRRNIKARAIGMKGGQCERRSNWPTPRPNAQFWEGVADLHAGTIEGHESL
jgi:hypothetical protein